MTKREIQRKAKEGRWVRVKYTDVGCLDAIITRSKTSENPWYTVYTPASHVTDQIDIDQIIQVGPWLNVPSF